MKKLLVAMIAALGVTAVHAEAIMTLNNKVGGKIVLTDASCKNTRGQSLAYYTVPEYNRTFFGCYLYDSATESVMVLWDNTPDQVRSYEVAAFTWTPYFTAKVAREARKNQQPANNTSY